MTDIFTALGRKALKRPGRTLLQTAVVAAGALAFAASISIAGALIQLERSTYNYRISVGNGTTDEAGDFNWSRTADLTRDLVAALPAETALIQRTAPVTNTRWNNVVADGTRYRIRSVVAAGEEYPAIMGLQLLAGRFFEKTEHDQAKLLTAISESVAIALFGSVKDALGKTIETEAGIMARAIGGGALPGSGIGAGASRGGAGQALPATRLRMTTVQFSVIGVYKDPTAVSQAALGLPDALIPFTTEGAARQGQSLVRTFVAQTDGAAPEQVAAAVRSALAALGKEDAAISSWEGSPTSPNSNAAEEARKMLKALSGALIGLGALILLVSVLGVYSWTSMEVADSTKQTAIRRALGEPASGSVQRFAASIGVFGSVAGLLGALLSIPAYRLLAGAAEAVLASSGTAEAGLFPALPPLWALVSSVLITAAVCVLFALPPAIGASRIPITSGIQEL